MDNQYFLGIDLDDQFAIISYFQPKMKEPETVSMVAGSEIFQIPLLLAKKRGLGQWFIGEEALKLALKQGEQAQGMLLSKALNGEKAFLEEECYPAFELLALFLKKLIRLSGSLLQPSVPDRLVITLETLSGESAELFFNMAPKLGLTADRITLIDRKESFYYFACSQKEELFLHDVCLYDYRGEEMRCLRLERNVRTTPQLVTLSGEIRQMDRDHEDVSFQRILKDTLKEHIVSSVYLIGSGFEGDWMKESLAFLCRGRRAFMGKNLYSKGACYAAAVREKLVPWPYVYIGDHEMKVNVSLKLKNKGQEEFYTLVGAGENCYEAAGECEVLISGTPEIDVWLQSPDSREAKVINLELSDLPERPDKATRLRITARPSSDRRVLVSIEDLGFGDIFKSSGKTWEHVVAL